MLSIATRADTGRVTALQEETVRLTLILGDSEADALTRLAVREDRAPRHQAERLLRESLVKAGTLAREARPCDRPLTAADSRSASAVPA